jgi:hypothetical protein
VPGRPHLSVQPRPRPRVAALLGVLALPLVLAACSGGPVPVATPELGDDDRAACEAFVAGLPDVLADEPEREVEPADALGAAYGDPAYVVRCGVVVPPDFDQAVSACEVAEGVGWYVSPEQFDDQDADVTLTAAGYRPVVEVTVPGEDRPDGPAAAIAELAPVVDEHLTLVENCD